MPADYAFSTAKKIVSGHGTIGKLGALANETLAGVTAGTSAGASARRAAIVTDPVIAAAGLLTEAAESLKAAGIPFEIFTDVQPEPSVEGVKKSVEAVRPFNPDLLIGIGGGSTLDTTKLISVLLSGTQPLESMFGIDLIEQPGLPMILVPTTSGTGSEVTPNAIVTIPEEERKVGVVSRRLFPDVALLDPRLTVSLPQALTAATGMDAMIHSLESYIGNKANLVSDTVALRGIRLIATSIRDAYSHGDDIEARERMHIGSMLGGMALTGAGTCAVHALAYPLGGKYGVPHGVANSMLLVPVMEVNMESCVSRLADVAEAMELAVSGAGENEKAEAVMNELKALIHDVKIPLDLREFGGKESDLDDLALSASKVTRLLANNPKELSIDEIKGIYQTLL